jgi:phage terminase small subunit
MSRPLNPRQRKFVEHFLANGNASRAYAVAGYRSRGAAARASAAKLLTNANIRAAIDEANRKAATQAEVNAAWVIQRLKEEALREGEGASHPARIRAVELLGKLLGMFTDKQELSGPGGKPIEHDHRLTSRIDELTNAFVAAARREEAGAVPGDGDRKPVGS